jgi:glutamate synthase (NADPH/NADH) small chain
MKPQREKRYSIGNTLDFLEIQRKDPGNRPKDERLRDYRNVELQLSHTEIQRQSARCMDCGTPFCHAYGCPISNVIPEMNDWVYRGKWREALSILLSTNNFPEFTGRVCPAPCEAACVAGINGEPVTIRQLELAIIEKGFETGNIHAAHPELRFDKRAAVIGAGPAGLSVADTLNKAGYPVIVYDSARYPGGILRYGIPDFKLEKWIVERRVRLMEGEGVIFETGVTVGEDLSYGYLRDRFDAICIACGAREPRDLLVPGRDLKEIHFAMDYLTQQNKRLGDETIDPSREITAQGKTVVVIGGGDTGSDCLGTALRQGAKRVYQLEILPKPPVERSKSTPWPIWPIMLHETHAHQEGGELYWSVKTKEFLGENGVLKKLHCVEVDWCLGEGGRLVPKEIEGTDFEVEADMVILAMGFVGPGEIRIIEEMGVELDDRGNVQADDHNMTNVAGLFVAGDSNLGQSLVVRAIADGRKAAQGIRAYLQ